MGRHHEQASKTSRAALIHIQTRTPDICAAAAAAAAVAAACDAATVAEAADRRYSASEGSCRFTISRRRIIIRPHVVYIYVRPTAGRNRSDSRRYAEGLTVGRQWSDVVPCRTAQFRSDVTRGRDRVGSGAVVRGCPRGSVCE